MAGESDILVRLRLKGEEFGQGVKDAFSGVGDEAERAGEEAGTRMAKGFGAKQAAFLAAGAAAFGLLVKAVNDSVELGANIAASAQQIGIGTDALQEYQYVAEQVGVSQNELEGTLQKLTLTIGEAASGNKKFTDGFAELGVSLTDTEGRGRTTDQVFQDIIKTLTAIEDPSERARIGAQLLGDQYQQMEPILALGADGVSELTDRLHDMNGVLSEEEIQKLQETNAKFDEMQRILSVNIAGAVAQNADGIIYLANALGNLAVYALKAGSAWADFQLRMEKFGNNVDLMNPLLGADARANLINRNLEINEARYKIQSGGQVTGGRPKTNQSPAVPSFGRTVTAPSTRGGGGGSSRKSGPSAEQREQERAAKAMQKEYERLEESLERQVESQEDAARIEEVRRTQGEYAAEVAKRHLDIERQFPTLINTSVEAVAERYKITSAEAQKLLELVGHYKELTEQASLDKWYDQQDRNFEESTALAAKQIKAAQDEAAEKQRRIQEAEIRYISDFYFDLFSGNTGNIWKDFKRQGLGVISDIAAQWTLALISGQDTSLTSIAGNVMGSPFPGGGSPLGSLLGAITGGASGQSAANDNGAAVGGIANAAAQSAGGSATAAASGILGGFQAGAGLAGPVGLYAGAVAVSDLVGQGISSALGIKYSRTAGGLFGAIGGIIGGMLKKTDKGYAQASISQSGELEYSLAKVNGSGRADAATGQINALFEGLKSISEQLGGNLKGGFTLGSIGTYKDKYSFDPTFGSPSDTQYFANAEDAVRAGLMDALGRGVIDGISDASQKILSSGQDLETAIEKALMIEQLPDLLQQRLDPLGYALDQIYDKYKLLADALREGGASAEQYAQAQQLWELEKADAIAAIGGASDGLKDFLLSLNAGSASPLSLRQQQAEAEAALAPYIAQIREAEAAKAELDRLRALGGSASDIEAAETAARIASQKIDQSGFQDSGSLLLNISRQIDASGNGFFTQFDRIRDLTNSAISLIDNAVPMREAAQDPFTEATANILTDHTDLLHSINDNLAKYLSGNGNGSFDSRNYAVSK